MTSLSDEYETFRTGNGYVELTESSTVAMTGADRLTFLHNMCTNDIKRLQPGDRCEAFCTDVKGKIVAQMFVIAGDERLDLVSMPGQAGELIAHLDRYIIREDVALADVSDETRWHFVGGRVDGSVVAACSRDAMGKKCGAEIWDAVRVELGLPLFGIDFDNTNLPQEVNRDAEAINFNKGCYLGQETIARIDALGHVNQKVVMLKFAGEQVPPVGLECTAEGKIVGRVTSSCWSPKFEAPLALAMVRRGSNDVDAELDSEAGRATVV